MDGCCVPYSGESLSHAVRGRYLHLEIIRLSDLSGVTVYDQAAALHIASIHHGLLPDLGHSFLSRLYREIDRTSAGGVWGAVESDRVLGFIAGSADAGRCTMTILRRAALPLARLSGRSLLKGSVLRRVPKVAIYPFRRNRASVREYDTIKAELLAIAVAPEARGAGIGSRLVEGFEEGLRSWGVQGRYRVATNSEDAASNRFYEKAGFRRGYTVSHNALTLQVYVKDLPNAG